MISQEIVSNKTQPEHRLNRRHALIGLAAMGISGATYTAWASNALNGFLLEILGNGEERKFFDTWELAFRTYNTSEHATERVILPRDGKFFLWTQSQFGVVEDSLRTSEPLLKEVWGEPAAWGPKKGIVLPMPNFLKNTDIPTVTVSMSPRRPLLTPRQQETYANSALVLVDGEWLNIPMEYPKIKNAALAHEDSHLYNAYNFQRFSFPRIVDEGLSEMAAILTLLKDPDEAMFWQPYFEEHEKDDISDVDIADIEETSFTRITNEDSTKARCIYTIAGLTWLRFYEKHSSFFSDLRMKENEFYHKYGKRPSFDEWKNLGNEVYNGFSDWLSQQPIFQLRD